MKVNIHTDYDEYYGSMNIVTETSSSFNPDWCLEIPNELYEEYLQKFEKYSEAMKDLVRTENKIRNEIADQQTPRDKRVKAEWEAWVKQEQQEQQERERKRNIRKSNKTKIREYLNEKYSGIYFQGNLPEEFSKMPFADIQDAIFAHNKKVEYSKSPEAVEKRVQREIKKLKKKLDITE